MLSRTTAWAARLSRPRGIAAGVAVLIAIGVIAAASAAGNPAPARPTITTTPPTVTTSTSATFTFTDSTSGVGFECALDNATYITCTSPRSYTGLAEGTHTFAVRASDAKAKKTSSAATYSWTVDRTPPPAPVLTGAPANPTNQQAATFAFSDGEAGVSYLCQRDGSAFAGCPNPVSYGNLAAGTHTFAVKAVDRAGNVGAVTTYVWLVDRTPPPAPTITSAPTDGTTDTTASFAFSDTEVGVTYRCALDGGAASTCASPKSYTGLSAGTHTFAVQAVDRAGNASTATSWTWTIAKTVGSVPISGDVSRLLYPGGSALLNVKITNPHHFDILVNSLTVTISNATTRNGYPNANCVGTVNLRVARQYAGAALTIAPLRTVTLADLGVAQSKWPQLLMPDLPTNQDACKGTTFTFGYSAVITKAKG